MKSFREFQKTIEEKVGDFGNPPLSTKENCYGRTVYYKQIKKRVCSKNTDSGSDGE
jgi:hypothetical protein